MRENHADLRTVSSFVSSTVLVCPGVLHTWYSVLILLLSSPSSLVSLLACSLLPPASSLQRSLGCSCLHWRCPPHSLHLPPPILLLTLTLALTLTTDAPPLSFPLGLPVCGYLFLQLPPQSLCPSAESRAAGHCGRQLSRQNSPLPPAAHGRLRHA